MTRRSGGSTPVGPSGDRPEHLSIDEFKRLVEEAQGRGEDITPLVRRLVLQTIREVQG